MSIHTAPGCTMPTNYGATGSLTASGSSATNCDAVATGDTGCGLRSSQANNYGQPYNNNGGGVHISMYSLSPLVSVSTAYSFCSFETCSEMGLDRNFCLLLRPRLHPSRYLHRIPPTFDVGYACSELACINLQSCNILPEPCHRVRYYTLR